MAGETLRLRDFGEDNFLFSFFRAITKRKRAGEEWRAFEERFRNLAERSFDLIFMTDAQGCLTYISTASEKIFHYKPEEMAGTHFKNYLVKSEIPRVSQHFAENMKGKNLGIFRMEAMRKDGSHVFIELNSAPIVKDGETIGIQGIIRNITERKKAEEALRGSEERYKALFQGAAEGIIVTDTETKEFKYVNPAICKMLGYTEEELGRLGVRDIHPKEDLQHIISEFEAQARGEKTLSSSIPCLRKDGTIMYADISTAMALIDGRQCNVGFFTDITERKRIKAELENYKEKVLQAQKHAYIASMGSIVAHQLNQPLTMINMLLAKALELEQAQNNRCPPVLKKIEESLTEAKKAALIIRKFHQYSRDPTLETTGKPNVSSTANRIISMLSKRAKQAKINISAKALDDLPGVEINETALEQIFLIIIQNAIEAADGRKQHKLDILEKFTDGNIKLQFSDDCCGIAPENLDKIFEPFFSIKSNGKGLGLGLEIVQQILIGHGGQIDVESQIDKGTTFYVTLPVKN